MLGRRRKDPNANDYTSTYITEKGKLNAYKGSRHAMTKNIWRSTLAILLEWTTLWKGEEILFLSQKKDIEAAALIVNISFACEVRLILWACSTLILSYKMFSFKRFLYSKRTQKLNQICVSPTQSKSLDKAAIMLLI